VGWRLGVGGCQASHALGTEEVFHDVTKVGAKRGVIVGWRLGVGGCQASHALGTEEVFRDVTKVGVNRGL
jgi:hypothetical protein